MVSTPRKTAVKAVDPQFSLLTCLFVSGSFLFLETLVDIVCHIYGGKISTLLLLVIHTDNRLLDVARLPHLYSFAVQWWTPLLVCCAFLGYRLGWRSIMYSFCGIVIFLVIIHNFRGITLRHNVFERADTIHRAHSLGLLMNIPDPLFWDEGYFVVALVGSLLGWLSRLPFRNLKAAEWKIGNVHTLWLGYACFLLGVIEALVVLLVVQSEDVYLNLPITHGYVLMAFGLVTVIAVQYRERLSEHLNFEVV